MSAQTAKTMYISELNRQNCVCFAQRKGAATFTPRGVSSTAYSKTGVMFTTPVKS